MNKSGSPQDALQEYMDDLLRDTVRPAPALQPVAEDDAYTDAELESIAQTRARVAKLLQSRPLPIAESNKEPIAESNKEPLAEVNKEPLAEVNKEPLAEVNKEPLAEVDNVSVAERPALNESVEVEALIESTAEELSTIFAEQLSGEEPVAEAVTAENLRWLDNGRPVWAQQKFEALLFKVSGLTLAVPLIALGQIQPLNEALTPIFGQADWFMGLQPTPMGRVRTVNTAKFVMPERYHESFLKTAKYVISIDGLQWGLAVDSVNQPIALEPGDVKWRTERSKRPWLAGTVKSHMCALIDIPMMGKLLLEADAAGSV